MLGPLGTWMGGMSEAYR